MIYHIYLWREIKMRVMTKQKFLNQWIRNFAPDLPKTEYEKYIKDQYIWHVFSWKLIEPDGLLVGDDARHAFDNVDKAACICCDMHGNGGVTDMLEPQYNTAAKIDAGLTEFYVVAKDYSWTYIKTHEGDFCGPYFLRKLR